MVRMNKRIFIILVALVLAVSSYGCRAKTSLIEEEEAEIAPAVTEKPTYEVKRGTVTSSIQFVDRIAPIKEKKLFFKTNGFVRAILVETNDEVKAGDLLAELETGDLKNRIAQAQVNLEKVQLRLAELQSNTHEIEKAEIELSISRLKLEQALSGNLAARTDIAKANLDKAALDFEFAKANDQGYTVPSYNLKIATLDHRIAEYNYQLALEEGERHEYGTQVLKKEVEANQLKVNRLMDTSDPQAVSEMKLAELALQRLETQIEEARIRSPIDGRVMDITIFPGKATEAFRPVIIVADPSSYEIAANLISRQISRLRVGQEVTITLVDRPGEKIPGVIRRLPYGVRNNKELLDDADPDTRISFQAPEDNVQIGDLARVTIVLEQKENVIFLPKEAIRTFQGRRFVVVEEGDRRRRVDVKQGIEGSGVVEIEKGLQEGEIIIGQ